MSVVRWPLLVLMAVFAAALVAGSAPAIVPEETDAAWNTALPCEAVTTQGGASRAAKGIVHVANVCGVVGIDVELQSRKDASGADDYAFLGTMGAGAADL